MSAPRDLPEEPVGGYRACTHPACLRRLAGSAAYCCGGCSWAHGLGADPDGYHSPPCDARAAQRGTWTPTDRPVRR